MRGYYWAFAVTGLLALPVVGVAATDPQIDRTEMLDAARPEATDAPREVQIEDFMTPEEAALARKRKREADVAIWIAGDGARGPSGRGDLLGAVHGDWNGDGFSDFAVLSVPVDQFSATLSIYEGNSYGALSKVAEIKETFGPHAVIRARSETAFSVRDAPLTGRDDWSRKAVIAFRDNDYIIAGVELRTTDGMAAGNESRCEWNLRTGQIVEQTQAGKDDPVAWSRHVSVWHAGLTEYFEVHARIENYCNAAY